MTSGFRREVAENCALLGHYAASIGNSLYTFRTTCRSHPKGSKIQNKKGVLNHEDGNDRFSRNVDNKLPLLAGEERRKAQFLDW